MKEETLNRFTKLLKLICTENALDALLETKALKIEISDDTRAFMQTNDMSLYDFCKVLPYCIPQNQKAYFSYRDENRKNHQFIFAFHEEWDKQTAIKPFFIYISTDEEYKETSYIDTIIDQGKFALLE